MQSWAFNTRRAKFQDPRLRLAFNYAFDFEWSNTNLFYGQYTRSKSFFNNSELAATGLPSAGRTRDPRTVARQIPAEVFTTEYVNPVNGNAAGSPQESAHRRGASARKPAGTIDPGWQQIGAQERQGREPDCRVPARRSRCSSASRFPTRRSSNSSASPLPSRRSTRRSVRTPHPDL